MKVLVVDDQPEVVQGVISGIDWERIHIDEVFSAYSVKDAKTVFEREDIDILLCDIEMPPTNGFALLRWAKERKPDIASIFLSAHAEFGYAQEAVKLGSLDYILQPAPYEEIEAAVERAIFRVKESKKLNKYYQYENYRSGSHEQNHAVGEADERMPLQRAMDYIRRNIDRDLSRTEIAEAIFLNPEYLSHLFKKETGSSLSEYILTERMRVAQSLLADTNIQVSIIASKVGYANFSYFSQVFKRHTGFSPMEYRAQRKQELKNENKL